MHCHIIYLDEFMVTQRTLPTHAWSLKKTNIEIGMKESYIAPKAAIIAISREYGLDHIEVFDFSVNKQKYKIFLQNLRDKYPFLDMHLVMDNLSLHKSADTRERYNELGFNYSFTPVYSPQYNASEEVINMGK